MPVDKFELFAFYSNPKLLAELIEAEIDGVIIDWENKGKDVRQNLYNTQVNRHSRDDLSLVKKQNPNKIICRINGPEYFKIDEIDKAIDLGVDELLVPMIKKISEVELILKHVNDRVNVGLMLETNEALDIADQLNQLPIHRFFVGLNDLCIQRKNKYLFLPFLDGTIDDLRPKITKKFGIAGLTHPKAGVPVPCSVLINQMKKYQASFGFLRRSFYKDLDSYKTKDIIANLRAAFDDLDISIPNQLSEDDHELLKLASI